VVGVLGGAIPAETGVLRPMNLLFGIGLHIVGGTRPRLVAGGENNHSGFGALIIPAFVNFHKFRRSFGNLV
jgi:hypothetical protein